MSKMQGGRIAVIVGCGLVAGLLLAGCATGVKKQGPPLTVGEIVQMSKVGMPAVDIIAKIIDSGTTYKMKASEFARLKSQGVPDEVIDYMQETYLHAIEREQQLKDSQYWTYWNDGYWYGGMPFGWPYDPYWYGSQTIVAPAHEQHPIQHAPASPRQSTVHQHD